MTVRTDLYLSQYSAFKGILQVYSGLGTSQSIIKQLLNSLNIIRH